MSSATLARTIFTKHKENTLQRFCSKVEPIENGCWLWTGGRHADYGYGRFSKEGRGMVSAHRWAYLFFIGEADQLHHLCHNKWCVNPTHLESMSPQEHAALHHPPQTYCHRGHEITYAPNGRRRCRECARLSMPPKNARYRAAHPDYFRSYYLANREAILEKERVKRASLPKKPRPSRKDPDIPFRTEKACGRCKQVLPLDSFGKRTVSPDGRAAYCKACKAEYKREHKALHLEEIRAKDRERARRNREIKKTGVGNSGCLYYTRRTQQ